MHATTDSQSLVKPKRKKPMRHYVYTYKERRSNHGRDRRVRIYRVKRNVLEFVGEYTDSFMGESQLVGEAAMRLGIITKSEIKALKKEKPYSSGSAWEWENRGVAKFTGVD